MTDATRNAIPYIGAAIFLAVIIAVLHWLALEFLHFGGGGN